ncbi:MAG: nuclear transport factor 2 family protein [Gammaproteobacteria bacterium]|jgi:predicted SnoaL-like aldol condensation-catalyzing enzyme|nr:nuclear transport factor 2 family protein [Gammaproteobacteria bacterium]
MKKIALRMSNISVLLMLALVLLLSYQNLSAQEQSELEFNKQLLIDFFAFEGSGIDRMEQFMAEDYVQHNPRFLAMDKFTGASGNRAWVEARIEARERGGIPLVDLGGIRLSDPIIVMAEGDLVTAIYKGDLPDPDNPGETYEAFAFETFRIRDGKFTEHWDQVTLKEGWMDTE